MTELTIFQNFTKVVANLSIEKIVAVIKSNKYKAQVAKLQLLLKQGKDKEYAQSKKSLPAFTPSGKFKDGRKMEFLQEYSRIIILDIDKVENITEIRKKAENCVFTHVCFISPSGNGLKILVKTDNSVSKHREAFLEVQEYYEKLLNIKIDPSGKDVSRLCFFSWDPEIYVNNESEIFKTKKEMSIKSDIENLIEQIDGKKVDITGDYDEWIKIGFALESEYGEFGRPYFHDISRHNHTYNAEACNEQYTKCLRNNRFGITIRTLFHIAKKYGVVVKSINKRVENNEKEEDNFPVKESKTVKIKERKKITSNKFNIAEEYLNQRYDIRYNSVNNKFEYKEKDAKEYEDLNENNLYVKLQKDNINLSLNNLVALLKSDFVNKHDPFLEYFKSLPQWDEATDYVEHLCSFVKAKEQERFNHHFLKWLVRTVKTATNPDSYNKQAFVLVSNRQNSGKSTFCRFLCPKALSGYIAENIGTDKDSHVAITENFLINLDELSQAEKAEINAFKSMFSKDRVKARLTYDKRASIHVRRASFLGSTDKWEFLTDENGSVRWLCMEIEYIDWNYSKEVDMDNVYSMVWHLAKDKEFVSELTRDEIEENDRINKKFQISSPEADLVERFFEPAGEDEDGFFTTPPKS